MRRAAADLIRGDDRAVAQAHQGPVPVRAVVQSGLEPGEQFTVRTVPPTVTARISSSVIGPMPRSASWATV